MSCIRCGHNERLESHHIKPKAEGGSEDPLNKEQRCLGCHDYEHAKRNILATIKKETKQKQFKRVSVLEHRLEVLEKLNTPDLIRKRGHYQTWWIDESTHEFLVMKK